LDVLSIDKGDTTLTKQAEIQKEMEREGVELLEGEVAADSVLALGPVGGMASTMGQVSFRTITGKIVTMNMDWRMSSASLIEFLIESKEKGRKVIFKTDNFGLLEYAREYEKIRPETPISERAVQIIPIEGTNAVMAIKYVPGKKERSKRFKSMEAYRKAEHKAREGKLDEFGDRWFDQTELEEFE